MPKRKRKRDGIKRRRTRSTRKLEDLKQGVPQLEDQEAIPPKLTAGSQNLVSDRISFRAIWPIIRKRIVVAITAISILLNFFLGYLTLYPNVTVDYASHILPENPIALPIKITNLGYLPIRNIIMVIKDNYTDKMNNNRIENISTRIRLSNRLGRQEHIEYVHDEIFLYNAKTDWNGSSQVSVQFQLPVWPNIIYREQKFTIYKSKDGFIRWISEQ